MTADSATPARPALRDLMDLTGRVAIVTGGSMGIGLGIARRLHEAGAAVVIADIEVERATEIADAMNAERASSATAVRTDVSDEDDVRRMTEVAVERMGHVDILVNNAGIYPNRPLQELDAATFRRVLDVNLTGLFLCTQAVAKVMIAQGGGGRIINITSIDIGRAALFLAGLAGYMTGAQLVVDGGRLLS